MKNITIERTENGTLATATINAICAELLKTYTSNTKMKEAKNEICEFYALNEKDWKEIAAALADFDRATENSEIIIISDIFCRHTAQGTKQAEKWVNDEIRKGNAKTAAEYAKNLKDFKTKRANERAKLEKDLRAITTEVETPKKAAKLVDLSAMLQMQR